MTTDLKKSECYNRGKFDVITLSYLLAFRETDGHTNT